MAKKEKLKTPEWIIQGYDSPEEYNKAKGIASEKKERSSAYPKAQNSGVKTFKIRICPKCEDKEVGVVVGEETKGKWKCKKCGWIGANINEKELTEDEFMKYLDEKGEEVS